MLLSRKTALITGNIHKLRTDIDFFLQEQLGELVKALRIVRNEILRRTRALVRVKLRGGKICRLCARVNERHIRTHKVADDLLKQRIVRAAENQRIHTCGLQRREIFLHHSLDDHIAAVHAAVLDQRHEQRTRLRKQVERAVLFVQILLVCTRTDDLIVKAAELNDRPSKREMDVLLNTGEMISMSLLAMAIQKLGFPVVSLTGWQIGLETNSNYSDARIKRIAGERLKAELDNGRIVIVAGFQGINKMGDVTTLGRGGSDTTAVAIAATLGADLCQIYTDVDGVYTADPRIVKDAKKLDAITYDEMLELASLGAQVLHNRSVEMAKKYNVDLEVVSSFTRNPGTKVKEGSNMEKLLVSGVARDNNCARVAIINLDDTPGTAFKVFSLMAKHNVNIDIILQSVGRDNKKSISFTIRQDDAERVEKILRDAKEMLGYEDISINTKVAKVSIVGAGMASATGVASKMFEALASAGINIRMISTSEIKISVLINEEDSEKAVKAIHEEFFNA